MTIQLFIYNNQWMDDNSLIYVYQLINRWQLSNLYINQWIDDNSITYIEQPIKRWQLNKLINDNTVTYE